MILYANKKSGFYQLKVLLSKVQSAGFIADVPDDFQIATENIDPSVSRLTAPQLVCPINNRRFAANAANAGCVNLMGALYTSDLIDQDGELSIPGDGSHNRKRGEAVFAFSVNILDEHFPIENDTSWGSIARIGVDLNGMVYVVPLGSSESTQHGLKDPSQFLGADIGAESRFLLQKRNLKLEIVVNSDDPVINYLPAGIAEINVQAAGTTIVDFEDAAAMVNPIEKAGGYLNWLELMQGTLSVCIDRGADTEVRTLNAPRTYLSAANEQVMWTRRSTLLARAVGWQIETDMVTVDGNKVPEFLVDAFMIAFGGLHDLRGNTTVKNSPEGSIYLVTPKLWGPAEVALYVEILADIERILSLPENTIKIGLMDEEMGVTLNLSACMWEARERLFFINTGFLDRTASQIWTLMHAGPFAPKAMQQGSNWIQAYEEWNVHWGMKHGLQHRGQIGKGMWPTPDLMAAMYETKKAHPLAGADVAWVPSPSAAAIHFLHYLDVDVPDRQKTLAAMEEPSVHTILAPVWMDDPAFLFTRKDVLAEVDRNLKSIMGYMAPWMHGDGCANVPDFDGIGRMEDQATIRISALMLANWILHGVTSIEEVLNRASEIAKVVNAENQHRPDYRPISGRGHPIWDAMVVMIQVDTAYPEGYTGELVMNARRTTLAA